MFASSQKNKIGLDEVYPPLTKQKIEKFLDGYIERDELKLPKDFELSNLPENIEKLLEQVYITKILKTKSAIQARFSQYSEYDHFFSNFDIKAEKVKVDGGIIDLILKSKDSPLTIAIIICDLLDNKKFAEITNLLIEYSKNQSGKKKNSKFFDYDEIHVVCGKIERKVIKDLKFIEIQSKKVQISFHLENIDPDRPFEDEDTIIIEDLEFKGFNFGKLEDLLSIIKSVKGKGKYSIFKENYRGAREKIWEGLIFPRKLLNN
ncbi:MAG: hypothetical protein ACTSYI_04665 [Promethearchaeota archaeon]